jgi:RND family efflux transporter MFP subunit
MKKPLLNKILPPLGILLLGLATFVFLLKTRPEPPRQPGQVPRPVVRVIEVPAETPQLVVKGFGTVRAKRRVELIPQVSGVVVTKSPAFEPGGFFSQDEVLLRIDDTDYRLAAEKAAAEVARAEYNLARAQEEAAVARREWEQISQDSEDLPTEPNPLVFHEPQLSLARAELAAARAAHAQAEVNLQRCTLKAPFPGRVMQAQVDAGQYLRAGSVVGSIYATDMAEVTVPIPDADLAWIKVPLDENLTADATALRSEGSRRAGDPPSHFDEGSEVDIVAEFAGAEHHWPGRVVRLAGVIDEKSRRVPVVVEIPNPYRTVGQRPPLVEGMFVETRILGQALPGAVTIPRAALRAENQVWVVDEEERLRIRNVTVARADVERAVITEGLSPGERVCVTSLQVVSDGMLVRATAEGENTVMATSAEPSAQGGQP